MNLTLIAFYQFAAAACGGILFVLLGVAKVRYPRWLAVAHGSLGLIACGVLAWSLYSADRPPVPQAWWSLGLLSAALLGGGLIFGILAPKRGRLLLAMAHGGLALAGIVLLYGVLI